MLLFLQTNFVYILLAGFGFFALAIALGVRKFKRFGKNMFSPGSDGMLDHFKNMSDGVLSIVLSMIAASMCEVFALIGFILFLVDKLSNKV